jgi:GT2 family glycosyltransferase
MRDRLPMPPGRRRKIRPDVALIVVTYLRDDMLAGTVAEIVKLETLPGRVIVIDQGDGRDKESILAPLATLGVHTTYVYSRYRSISAARNIGLEYAGPCEIVLYLDDDVEIISDIVANHADYYDNERDLAGVAGHVICEPHSDNFVRQNTVRPLGDYVQTGRGCHMSFRVSHLREIGGFNAYICNNGDETELYRRLARAGKKIRNGSMALIKHLVCPTGGNREVKHRSHDNYGRVVRDGMIRCVKDRGPWAGVVWPIKNWRATAGLFRTAPTRTMKWWIASREIARGYRLAILSRNRRDYIDLSLQFATGVGVDPVSGLPTV